MSVPFLCIRTAGSTVAHVATGAVTGCLAAAVGNPAFGEVVGSHLHSDLVTG